MSKNLSTRVSALEESMERIEASINVLVARLEPTQPAKVTPKRAPKAQPKADAKPAKRCLTRGNRDAFVQDHPWAKGMSTKAIATEIAQGRRRATKGWALGEGYKALCK